jgi:hypothetical protein
MRNLYIFLPDAYSSYDEREDRIHDMITELGHIQAYSYLLNAPSVRDKRESPQPEVWYGPVNHLLDRMLG